MFKSPQFFNSYGKNHMRETGMTLIEVVIVVSLIGVVYAVAMPQFNIITGTDRAEKMSRLAQDVRAAFDLAVLSNKSYRLTFELKTGDYWLESASRRNFFLSESESDVSGKDQNMLKEEFESQFEVYEELYAQSVKDSEGEEEIKAESPLLNAKDKLAPVRWLMVENIEWGERSIGPDMLFQDIQCEHHQDKQTLESNTKVAVMYFLPHGYVEKCVIHVAFRENDDQVDKSQEPYTVTTDPFQGTAHIDSGYIEVELNEKS